MIFPDVAQQTVSTAAVLSTSALTLAKEYAFDFEKNDFLLVDGKNKIVSGMEAVKVWIFKALQTERYRYLAYSWNYGNELEDLIGQGFSNEVLESEIERCIKEALLINPYITSITNFSVINGSELKATFTVNTIYGEVNMNV